MCASVGGSARCDDVVYKDDGCLDLARAFEGVGEVLLALFVAEASLVWCVLGAYEELVVKGGVGVVCVCDEALKVSG